MNKKSRLKTTMLIVQSIQLEFCLEKKYARPTNLDYITFQLKTECHNFKIPSVVYKCIILYTDVQ